MSDRKMPDLWYIGDIIVGVVSACDCPATPGPGPEAKGGAWMIAEHPHEGHDIVKPVTEDDLPEGVCWEDWIAWCRMFAAAPKMLALLKRQLAAIDNTPMGDMNYAGLAWHREARALVDEIGREAR
jgi:hypothetical protein